MHDFGTAFFYLNQSKNDETVILYAGLEDAKAGCLKVPNPFVVTSSPTNL
jgi:hypothetical protein